MEENKMIRWGIAGPGVIAEKFVRAVKNVPDAELYAVASRDAARGNIFAEKHGIKNIFLGYEAMAKDPLVDAVYVSTPHPLPSARSPSISRKRKERSLRKTSHGKRRASKRACFCCKEKWRIPYGSYVVEISSCGQRGDFSCQEW